MSQPNCNLLFAVFIFVLTSNAIAANGFSQETPNQWRVTKLAGVPIYGPENQKDGTITEVLMSKAGQAEYVIIGVGGLLGIDQKDVAVPIDHVKFTDRPMLPPANPAEFDTIGSSITATATNQANNTAGTGARAMTRSTAYPDHGVIDMTVDQLKSAPTLKYAR